MQVPHDAFVVVVDGRKMLFFRNEGDADRLIGELDKDLTGHPVDAIETALRGA